VPISRQIPGKEITFFAQTTTLSDGSYTYTAVYEKEPAIALAGDATMELPNP
jgi:hypothetical protein